MAEYEDLVVVLLYIVLIIGPMQVIAECYPPPWLLECRKIKVKNPRIDPPTFTRNFSKDKIRRKTAMNPSEITIPIKIIFSENLNEELNIGLSCFIDKPFDKEKFKAKVLEIIDKNMSIQIGGKPF